MTRSVRSGRLALLLLVGAAAACRVERRPDLTPAEEPPSGTIYVAEGLVTTPLEDSLLSTVVALTDAFSLGDGARVAQLTTRDAVLIDQEDAIVWSRVEGSPLPRPLSATEEGLTWQRTAAFIEPLGDGAALYSLLFSATVAADRNPWTAVESWVLVREGAGWRVRYLHRSRGPGRDRVLP